MNMTDLQATLGPLLLGLGFFVTLLILCLIFQPAVDLIIKPSLDTFRNLKLSGPGRISLIILLFLSSHVLFYAPGRCLVEKVGAKKEMARSYGAPIINSVISLKDKIFRPKAIVILDGRVMIYNDDNKVYALDGIHVPYKPEDLTIGTNVSYLVYSENNQLWLTKLK